MKANPSPIQRSMTIVAAWGLSVAIGSSAFAAAPFDCGSTGAYGPMNITQNTALDLPPDGIFNCTTIAVAGGATLRFNRNSFNTPVSLLASGDVVVNGVIDVSGSVNSSGPGGFDGGRGGSAFEGQSLGGDGSGPGAGKHPGRICGNLGEPSSCATNRWFWW